MVGTVPTMYIAFTENQYFKGTVQRDGSAEIMFIQKTFPVRALQRLRATSNSCWQFGNKIPTLE
jgi:hypothetical protein